MKECVYEFHSFDKLVSMAVLMMRMCLIKPSPCVLIDCNSLFMFSLCSLQTSDPLKPSM